MASPIAHSFAGFWTFFLLRAQLRTWLVALRPPWLLPLALLVLLANLPDLDFFAGLGFHANELHRGFTHSLAAAIMVSLGLSWWWRIIPGFWASTLLYFTAYGSHLLIDLCTGTKLGWTHSGYGIPLFWPAHDVFTSPFILFFGVRHKKLSALFSLDNLWSCTYELLVCGAITILILALRARWSPSRTVPLRPSSAMPTMSKLQQD